MAGRQRFVMLLALGLGLGLGLGSHTQVVVAKARQLVPVVAVWDDALGPDGTILGYELERDGAPFACAPLTPTSCSASVPQGTAVWRLRGQNALGWGPWSDPVTASTQPGTTPAPGAPYVLALIPPDATDPDPPPQEPHMAATIETYAAPSSAADFTSAAGSQDFTVDGGSGANRVMYVYAWWRYDRGHTISFTFDGVSLSAVGSPVGLGSEPTQSQSQLYRLIAPASGSNTLTLSNSAGSGSAYCWFQVAVVQDADQTTPNDTPVHESESGSGANTTQDVTVSSATGDLVLTFALFLTGGNDTVATVSGSSYTLHQETRHGGTYARMTTGSVAGAASVTPATTYNNGGAWGATRIGININAAGASARAYAGPFGGPFGRLFG